MPVIGRIIEMPVPHLLVHIQVCQCHSIGSCSFIHIRWLVLTNLYVVLGFMKYVVLDKYS